MCLISIFHLSISKSIRTESDIHTLVTEIALIVIITKALAFFIRTSREVVDTFYTCIAFASQWFF